MSDTNKGILAVLLACIIWGLSSLVYYQLKHVPALEILSHRTVWSMVFFLIIITAQSRLSVLRETLQPSRQLMVVVGAAVLISFNWFGFIWAVSNGYALESSLGYYIFPLVAILLGRVFLGERLTGMQLAAAGLAVTAVIVLTLGLGVTPWIAIWLAMSFAGYGLLKKRLSLGPVISVTAEVTILTPFALFYIVSYGSFHTGDTAGVTLAWLVFSGPLTAVPLILFSFAAKSVRLSTMGILQYVNPTLQFLCATLVFSEPFTRWHAIAFAMIWSAVAIYSIAAIRQDRASRRRASKADVSSHTVT